ncbi:hypothetical protein JYK00_07870 [Thermosipho ferrireducens]|uniref:Uncharacterized protein n=1 Tax=Thermosipho ferrireducens TaxID=2571116 RepID=A0ABX7S562_9BACT|nr:hypothetical protein [Thermosipho ferrireducens]QTA37639.1 hypothetical protein JYK00_07870 [Thermosipho ferrireducens]
MTVHKVKRKDLAHEVPLVDILKLVIQVLIPVILFAGMMYVTTYFSNITLKLENEKQFYETKLIDLQNDLNILEKNIDSTMVGFEIIK